MADKLSVLGKSVRQKDGLPRVTGKAKYYSDIALPGTLYSKIMRSPHPQADIIHIDTSKAQAIPGVSLVMDYRNFPKVFRKDLHYAGEHVVAVIAVDEETAESALEFIEIEYKTKPYVLNIEEAMAPDAPQVFDGQPNCHDWELSYYLSEKDPETNLWTKKDLHDFHGFGDVAQGFNEADVIVEEKGLKYAFCKSPAMNPRGCLMSYDNEKLTVYTHSQGMHHEKTVLAEVLGLPIHKVNYVSPYTGSSFGGKIAEVGDFNHPSHYLLIAGFATLALQKPVKCAYTRKEEMLCGWSRGSLANLRLGFKKDGTLTTIDFECWMELGSGGDKWPVKNTLLATGTVLYARNCKHMRGKLYYVHTNRFLSCGWQGYGAPEGHYAMETVMDIAAEKLGIDPVELRRINHMRTGDVDAGYDPLTYKSCLISSSGISECLDAGAKEVDWKEKWQAPGEKTGRIRHGMGVGIFCMGAGRPGPGNSTAAMVKVFPDGTASLCCALADLGQGQHTVQPQLVAEVLGIPYKNVGIVCHDTDSTPWATIVASSCGTWIQGWATYEAAMDVRRQLLELAGSKLGVNAAELDIKNAIIFVKSDPEKKITFDEAFGPRGIYGGNHELVGYYCSESPHTKCLKDGNPDCLYIPKEKGAQFITLDVDTETGAISNVHVVVAQNVGLALNPKIVAGQFLNVRHGVENATLGSDCLVDRKNGRLLNCNWIEYKPTSLLDCDVTPLVIEKPGDPTHPFGATACGEGAACPTLAAFSNAIYNAIGVRIKETPFTPDKILKALGKIKDRKKRGMKK
ncbi:xanthine dehydrogenase family protein molybdopterin-binding subunit [Desulfocicer niacini]